MPKRKEAKEKRYFNFNFIFNFIFIFNFKVCRRFCCGKMPGKPYGKTGAKSFRLLLEFEPFQKRIRRYSRPSLVLITIGRFLADDVVRGESRFSLRAAPSFVCGDGAFLAAKSKQSRRQISGTCLEFAGWFAVGFAAIFVAAKSTAKLRSDQIFCHAAVELVEVVRGEAARPVLQQGLPEFAEVEVIGSRIHVKPVVETEGRPERSELLQEEIVEFKVSPDDEAAHKLKFGRDVHCVPPVMD